MYALSLYKASTCISNFYKSKFGKNKYMKNSKLHFKLTAYWNIVARTPYLRGRGYSLMQVLKKKFTNV
jgi:hypothetical protein